MEEIPHGKIGAVVHHGLPGLPSASSDSKVQGVEKYTTGVLEAVECLPESVQELIVTRLGSIHTISHAHSADGKAPSKKLKRSTSGEVNNFTDEAAIPTPPLKLDYDPLSLNASAQGPSATTGERYELGQFAGGSNQLVQENCPGWSLFRMLIPEGCDQGKIENIIEDEKAKICIHPVAGDRLAMVWAKEDPCSSTSPAVEGLVRVHRYVLDNLVAFTCFA